MLVSKIQFVIVSTLLLLLSLLVSTIQGHYSNTSTTAAAGASTSPWLKNITTNWPRSPWPRGCRGRPWVCRRKEEFSEKWPDPFRQRWRCCRDRCVDVSSDVYNCGLCGIRCPFSWQCCGGFCSNTNISPFNCGRCGNRCPYGVRCLYGMCGYAEPDLPPGPRPPFPFPPKRPWPPRPHPPPFVEQ